MKIPDPDRVEKNKIKFLAAMYELANEAKRDPLLFSPHARMIGERCGFDETDTDRIETDLKADGLIQYTGGGPLCCLTKDGRDFLEEHLFNKTAKGKFRTVTSKSKELARTGVSKLLVYLSGLISGWATAAGAIYFRPILDSFKHWLGMK
jgi:hypothetical protein